MSDKTCEMGTCLSVEVPGACASCRHLVPMSDDKRMSESVADALRSIGCDPDTVVVQYRYLNDPLFHAAVYRMADLATRHAALADKAKRICEGCSHFTSWTDNCNAHDTDPCRALRAILEAEKEANR